jgi:signal transduction histidine kinase
MQLFGQLLVNELPAQEPIRLLLVVGAIVATPALFSQFQHVVDRLFYGGWYDYRSVVSDISRRLSSVPDRHTLEALLLGHTADVLWVHTAALLLPESHSKERLVGQVQGMLETDVSLLTLNINGDLGRYLRTLHRPIEAPRLRQNMVYQGLDPTEASLLQSEAIRWWVPIVSEDGLVGLLLLGARLGNERFDADDLRILGTLADQAGLAIRNILLVEELQLHIMEIENSHHILEQMHEQLLIGREAERKRLAREIHDNPVHCLIAFRYRLRECAAQTDDDDLRTSLEQLREEISVLLDELRGLCRQLRPPLLDAFGLASAIRAYGNELAERSGLSIHSEIDEEEDWQLPEEIAVSLFRVHQEALLNIIKHAHAKRVTVRLFRDKTWITLEVKDDGVGFTIPDSLEKLAAAGHFGLLGIRERIELLSGTFELTSQVNLGTTLHAQVPQNRKRRK